MIGGADLRRTAKKIRECEADVKQEQKYQEEQQAKTMELRGATQDTTAIRDDLARQLMRVAGDVGNVHNEVSYE